MVVLFKSASLWGTRMKLLVAYLLMISVLSLLCYFALSNYIASKAVVSIDQQKKVFVQTYNLGLEEFLIYRLSGTPDHLNNAVDLLNKANKRLYILSRLDSVFEHESADKVLLDDYLGFSGSGVESGLSAVRVGPLKKLVRIQPENMYHLQNISQNLYSTSVRVVSLMRSSLGEQPEFQMDNLQEDLLRFVALSAAFDVQIDDISVRINHRMLCVFGIFVLFLALGITFMLLYLVRSVALKRMAQKEQWIQQGISQLDDEMRGNYDQGDLSIRIIQTLQRILGAPMGALYYYDPDFQKLLLSGSSGVNVADVKNSLALGEGFAGQAAGKDEIQMIRTNGQYHKFYGSTGDLIPEFVYLVPLFYSEEIQGVIELALLQELDDTQMRFLKLSSERMSIALRSALMIVSHNDLLLQNKEQAEALQRQQFELNQSMHATLIRENALLDSMLNTLPDNIYFKDLESRFLRISESMVHFFGVSSAKEVIGKSDFDFQSPENARKFYDEEQEIIKTGKGFFDVVVKEADSQGNVLWSSISKLPLYDETGKCIGTYGISKNITNVKELEESVLGQNEKLINQQKELQKTIAEMMDTQKALKTKMSENEEMRKNLEWEKSLMDALLGNIPDSIYFKDLESKFLKVSTSLSQKFNMSDPSQLEGLSDFDIHDPEHARHAFDAEQNIIKTREPIIGLVEEQKRGDKTKYVLSTKMPFFDQRGNVLGTFGISKDITEMKMLEMEISHQNDQLMVQQEELRVTNDELNTQQEELKAANEELQSQEEELRVSNEELEERSKEVEIQRKEVVGKNKELVKAQNELLQKARDLELASQYKSDFLANMSHELRTPLNSLLILSKILANNKAGNLLPEQVKSAHIIYNSGKDLLELINEVLDLSKIEAGKMSIELSEVSTQSVTSEILQLFKPIADEKKLFLNLVQDPGFPEVISTDRQRLMQIIRNLLSNAFKFTSNGGITVRLEVPDPKISFPNRPATAPPMYAVSVNDTGVGIPKIKLEAIFEAFQQADGSISRRFGGTGLGLSISKQLSRLLGGEIRVESSEGVGSTFTVFLPFDVGVDAIKTVNLGLAEEKSFPPASIVAPETPAVGLDEALVSLPVFIEDDRHKESQGTMVLIIHSEISKAKKILKQCHKRNFNAVVAENIPSGIILAQQFRPRAIILSAEFNVPREFKLLKESDATRGLPVHFVSRIEGDSLDKFGELTTIGSESVSDLQQTMHEPLEGSGRILLVEDDQATRQAVQMLLSEKNVVITEATTAQQAYELLKSSQFECVILDLGLPDYSGKELLEKLKKEKITLPNVIIHTARDLSEKEFRELQKLSSSIVVKGLKSDERLMDEVTLFLHQLSVEIPVSVPKNDLVVDEDQLFKGKKVLIVDDDIRNIFALAQVLEDNGIEILEAENGQVALDMLELHKDIDLVLMDLMMPEMDGFEAMKIIREMDRYKDVPIITVSAKAMKEDHQKALEYGANDYIAKPVDDSKLLSLLKIWLKK